MGPVVELKQQYVTFELSLKIAALIVMGLNYVKRDAALLVFVNKKWHL